MRDSETENAVNHGRREFSEEACDQLFGEFYEQMDQVLLRYLEGDCLGGDEKKITDVTREKEDLGMTCAEITKEMSAVMNADFAEPVLGTGEYHVDSRMEIWREKNDRTVKIGEAIFTGYLELHCKMQWDSEK